MNDKGDRLIAQTLKQLDVTVIFGLVGIPIVEVALECQKLGILFVGFRNEQSAAYAAGAYGYLTGRPGICLTVGGPGMIHALAGLYNAAENRYPMILISGSCSSHNRYKGAFQETNSILVTKPFTKFSAQVSHVNDIPFLISTAYRNAFYGCPGSTFIDIPEDVINGTASQSLTSQSIHTIPNAPRILPASESVQKACELIKSASFPLLVLGKGCAIDHSEDILRKFVDKHHLPFLTSPMGKGLVSDDHECCLAAAKSKTLKKADVVVMLGARLNWLYNFGEKIFCDPIFIQVDIDSMELGHNVDLSKWVGIQSNVSAFLESLDSFLSDWKYTGNLFNELQTGALENKMQSQHKLDRLDNNNVMDSETAIMCISSIVYKHLDPQRITWIAEGANSLDHTRKAIPIHKARARLDPGTTGTMGTAMGYTIAAHLARPEDKVIAIVGDSAFGFSAMELETITRYNIPALIFIINNGGIYKGVGSSFNELQENRQLPCTSLNINSQYEKLAQAFSADGYRVTTYDSLMETTEKALKNDKAVLINVIVDPKPRNEMRFNWHSSS